MIVEAYLPNWKDYEEIYNEWSNKSSDNWKTQSTTVGFDIGQPGIPNSFDVKLKEDYNKAIQQIIPNWSFGKILNIWGVYYRDYGYQTVHRHNQDSVATILYFDTQPEEDKLTTLNGLFYTIHDDQHKTIKPEPGKLLLINWDVWHGVYPAKEPRRSFMVDFAT